MIYILAGKPEQADEFINRHGLSRKQAMFVRSKDSFRGVTLLPGDVVRIGNYHRRRDIGDIENEIAMATHG
jgi:hypothetical protein